MKGLLWVLTLSGLAVGIALAAHYNEGYLLLVLPPYRVEVSLNLAILLVVGAFAALYALLRAVALVRALPRRVREFRERRRREKVAESFDDIARLVFEGRFGQAMKKAGEAYAAGQSPALAALLAAYSALRLHQPEKQQDWLGRALQADAKMQSAVLMLEAQMHLQEQRYAAARDVLKRLQLASGRHIAALRLELRAEQGCENWHEVLRLVRQLETHQALAPEEASAIEHRALQAMAQSTAALPA